MAAEEEITCPVCFGYGHPVTQEGVASSWTDNNTGLITVIYHDCTHCNGRGRVDAAKQRQYMLDAATFAWTLAFRRWQADDTKPFPRLAPFAKGLSSEQTATLVEYALEAVLRGLPDVTADEQLS